MRKVGHGYRYIDESAERRQVALGFIKSNISLEDAYKLNESGITPRRFWFGGSTIVDLFTKSTIQLNGVLTTFGEIRQAILDNFPVSFQETSFWCRDKVSDIRIIPGRDY